MHILFVCTGNSCRSPMAEAYLAQLCAKADRGDVKVTSAGTSAWEGAAASPAAIETMKEQNINLELFRSTQLTVDLIRGADLIVAMTEAHRYAIIQTIPEAEEKTKLLLDYVNGGDVPDPFGGSVKDYKYTFQHMKEALAKLAEKVLN